MKPKLGVWCYIICIMWLQGCICHENSLRQQIESDIGVPAYKVDPIETDFMLSRAHELRVRVSPAGRASVPQGSQIVVVFDGKLEATVQRLEDLEPYVEIDSAKKALSFVRLLTGLIAHETCFRDRLGWEVPGPGEMGVGCGKIDPKILSKVGWHKPVIRQKGKQWYVTRYVVDHNPYSSLDEIFEVTEIVSFEGEYQRVKKIVKYEGDLDVLWLRS